MTSQDFIRSIVNGERTKARTVASIYFNGTNIYSYGTHYPLLFKINGRWILNDRGYSATTGRHISWAWPFAAFRVHLERAALPDYDDVLKSATAESQGLTERLAALSSRAFRQRERLTERLQDVNALLDFLHTTTPKAN